MLDHPIIDVTLGLVFFYGNYPGLIAPSVCM